MSSIFPKVLITIFVLVVIANFASAQLVQDGLVSYWSFNDDTIEGDTLNDLWGENHGTLIENPKVVKGIYGQALEFTGKNHVDIPDSESLDIETGEVSVTAWALRTGPGKTERGGIVEKGNGGITNTPLLLREWNNGTVDFEVRNEITHPNWPKLQSKSVALVDGEWVFLAGTYDGKVEKIYINSKLDATMKYDKGFGTNDKMLRIGWDPHSPDRHFVGIIDEIAIYDRALTANEVKQNENASLGLAVEPAGKLSATWAQIKTQRTR